MYFHWNNSCQDRLQTWPYYKSKVKLCVYKQTDQRNSHPGHSSDKQGTPLSSCLIEKHNFNLIRRLHGAYNISRDIKKLKTQLDATLIINSSISPVIASKSYCTSQLTSREGQSLSRAHHRSRAQHTQRKNLHHTTHFCISVAGM